MKNYFNCVNTLEVFINKIKDYKQNDLMPIINDPSIINDDMIKIIISRFYVDLLEKNITNPIEKRLILKIEENYDNINFLRHLVCSSIHTFNSILSIYKKSKIFKKSQVLYIYHKGKQEILKKLDPHFNFIGFETEYIKKNKKLLDLSLGSTFFHPNNKEKLSIIFGRAYIYGNYIKNGLYENYPVIDFNYFKRRWETDEVFNLMVLRDYTIYTSKGKEIQEKMMAEIIHDKSKLMCLLRINPSIMLERLENKFVRLGITVK